VHSIIADPAGDPLETTSVARGEIAISILGRSTAKGLQAIGLPRPSG
jgi:hypothetical protein